MNPSIPYEIIGQILSYYNDLHDPSWHLALCHRSGRIRMCVHTNETFLHRLEQCIAHQYLHPPIESHTMIRYETDLYHEVFHDMTCRLPPMVPITMIRLPSYVSHDYSYMPVYTWIDTGGTIEYAYTLYHIPVSEAWGERIARFYRGWKYASHHKRMHQMIYHMDFDQNQDMVFHSNTELSMTMFRKDGYWQWHDMQCRWNWTTYPFTIGDDSDADTE